VSLLAMSRLKVACLLAAQDHVAVLFRPVGCLDLKKNNKTSTAIRPMPSSGASIWEDLSQLHDSASHRRPNHGPALRPSRWAFGIRLAAPWMATVGFGDTVKAVDDVRWLPPRGARAGAGTMAVGCLV